MLRILLLATVLLVSPLPAAAQDTVVTISWAGVQRSELSIARMRVVLFPRVRRAVCDSYRKGTSPGWVLKSGGTVKVVFRGAGGDILTSFSITREKCA